MIPSILILNCLIKSTVAVRKQLDQSNLGRKGLFTYISISFFIIKERQVRNVQGQESWDHVGFLFTELSLMACLACFLVEATTCNPGKILPTMICHSPSSIIKKSLYRLAKCHGCIISTGIPFSVACFQLTIKMKLGQIVSVLLLGNIKIACIIINTHLYNIFVQEYN